VREGQEVCVLEAMKMEQSIRASRSGTVHKVFMAPGLSVQAGDPLIELE
ncbi:MAG: acetyl-CoA carboxylase biotin carboxyl carrier protein subunit, partial [Chloroflexi bacterium]|nr:acetyl-CoA carboxylase biotin carboxyl carrier protein subunit [Chloroflexota bacterium]